MGALRFPEWQEPCGHALLEPERPDYFSKLLAIES